MIDLLRHILTASLLPAIDSIEALREATRRLAPVFPTPFDRGAAEALACDRVGFAFAAGYQAALHALVPAMPTDAVVSLCATEEGGAHPRAIATRLERAGDALRVRGKKRWSTFAPAADALLVVASIGEDGGRNRLRVVRVDRRADGVRIDAMPAPPFAPEIPHAEVTLDVAVRESDVLEGDGYDRYVKPFRTIEDAHVLGALLAHVAGMARAFAWPRDVVEEIAAWTIAVRAMAIADPSAPEIHVALAGAFAGTRAVVARATACAMPDEVRARWERDRGLLEVAGNARKKRLDAAWTKLAP